MGKKCIPGIICIENTTIFVIFVLLAVIAFLWYQLSNKTLGGKETTVYSQLMPPSHSSHLSILNAPATIPVQDVRGDVGRCNTYGGTIGDPLTNAYVPPIKCDGGGLSSLPLTMSVPSNAVPINIPTQHYNTQYTQIGILTKKNGSNSEILPLMARRTITSRDKWQYYTVSGGGAGGNLQTKLPIRVKGKSCSGEYGCPEVYSGDDVFVEGFQETFQATIYENGMFSYIPY